MTPFLRMLRRLRALRRLLPFGQSGRAHEWFTGDYATWEEARSQCSGYDAPAILEKVRDALLKVKNGEAVYERDSVLFDKVEYSLPLVAFLLYVSSASNGELNIVDYGGSLGSTYFQNRKFLNRLKKVNWSIVEQSHFVACGRNEFEDESLAFFESIEGCKDTRKPNCLLLSSVLPYLDDPKKHLRAMLDHNFEFIILDRTPFLMDGSPDRLTIEHVPDEIYKASYPAWFFNYESFIDLVGQKYELFENFAGNDTQTLPNATVKYLAMMFIRKHNG